MIMHMTKESLEAKKKAAEDEFNELETRKQEIVQRQFELRGKYQSYDEQLVELGDATTVVATPEKGKKNG